MIELLACRLGRNDEAPNIALAEKLCEDTNVEGVREIADGLQSSDQAAANDCIKVLYEIGYRQPGLIADFANVFITALASRNNRIVWGSMTALSYIAPLQPNALYARLPEIIAAYQKGSVITVDNSISVFAHLCNASETYGARIFPLLLEHLATCRAKDIPQHAERMAVCIDARNKEAFTHALHARLGELSETQKSRVLKLMKRF